MVAVTEKVMQASARKLFLFQVHTLNGWRLKLQKQTVKPKSHLPGVVSLCDAAAIFALQRQQAIAGALAFWMANSSELLNFLKHDKHLSPLTQQCQLDLSHLVHKAYR